ncbi:MAG: nucleoside recognition domain-containing protein [Pseudomonadota bacterium]
MLGWFWSGCIVFSFIACVVQLVFLGNTEVFNHAISAVFDTASLSVEIAIGLIGLMAVWLGFFKIAEHAGIIDAIANLLTPFFQKLMPDLPARHPAIGSMTMNLGANALGLDNAATPLGIKAMKDLQEANSNKDTLSDAQILFLVLNTSAVTVIPVTVFLYRAQQGAAHPSEVFIPILISTFASTLVGLLSVAYVQKLPLINRTVLIYLAAYSAMPILLAAYFLSLSKQDMSTQAQVLANFILFAVVTLFLIAGWRKKINVYDSFIEGAKQGFDTAIKLIPYLVAMLLAISLLRASGILGGLLGIVSHGLQYVQIDTAFIEALPTAIMKPFSGSGARAAMIEVMQNQGVDSFPAKVAAVMQGSTETTFYVLAVYCGAVGITKIRYAMTCGLLADAAGITTAIFMSYAFFGG